MITLRTPRVPAKPRYLLSLFAALLVLSGCGSSDDDDNNQSSSSSSSSSSAPSGPLYTDEQNRKRDAEWPEVNVFSDKPKTLQFSWTPAPDATYYRLMKNPDGSSGYTQVGSDITDTSAEDAIDVHRHDWHDASYIVEACDAGGNCENSATVYTDTAMFASIGYFKASNTSANDWFGWSLALSGDGHTMAVGAPREASGAQGVDGNQDDASVFAAGAVYVFHLDNGVWTSQGYIKASNTDDENDRFGFSVSLSDDGNTLAVGAPLEDSDATGVNGDQDNNDASGAGAVYTFARTNGNWAQTAYLKPSNTAAAPEDSEGEDESGEDEIPTNAGFRFGHSVHLSGDGSTLAVGAIGETSSATGVNGDDSDTGALASGAVYLFTQENANWSQQAYVKASNTEAGDVFGWSVALSETGNRLAVGAIGESSTATGVNGDEENNEAPSTGAVYLYTRGGTQWEQEAYVKPGETYNFQNVYQRFGNSVSLSADGNTLAVGTPGDISTGTGVDAEPDDYDASSGDTVAPTSGAAYLFTRTDGSWAQTAYVKASNNSAGIAFGRRLALSGDGEQLLVAAWHEHSGARGIDGDQTSEEQPRSGAAYLFTLDGNDWRQSRYIKAPNTATVDGFGSSVDVSADGASLGIGAYREKGGDTGVNGDRYDRSADYAGSAFLY